MSALVTLSLVDHKILTIQALIREPLLEAATLKRIEAMLEEAHVEVCLARMALRRTELADLLDYHREAGANLRQASQGSSNGQRDGQIRNALKHEGWAEALGSLVGPIEMEMADAENVIRLPLGGGS